MQNNKKKKEIETEISICWLTPPLPARAEGEPGQARRPELKQGWPHEIPGENPGAVPCHLPGCALAGSQNQLGERQDSNPGALAGISYPPNANNEWHTLPQWSVPGFNYSIPIFKVPILLPIRGFCILPVQCQQYNR